MKCARAIISFIFLALMLVSCDNQQNQNETNLQNPQDSTQTNEPSQTTAQIGLNYYQPFTLYLSSGKTINMQKTEQGFKTNSDKIILLHFFTSSCGSKRVFTRLCKKIP